MEIKKISYKDASVYKYNIDDNDADKFIEIIGLFKTAKKQIVNC